MLPVVNGEFRAGTDATLRFSPSGLAISEFRGVASSRKKNDEGEWQDDKSVWLTFVAFGKLAENVAESVTKGKLVNVTGKLSMEEWEKDGEKRTTYKVACDFVGLSMAFAPAKLLGADRVDRSADATTDAWATPTTDTPKEEPKQTDEPPF